MEKERQFLTPQAEIVRFNNEDLIVTSDVGGKSVGEIPEWPPQNQ